MFTFAFASFINISCKYLIGFGTKTQRKQSWQEYVKYRKKIEKHKEKCVCDLYIGFAFCIGIILFWYSSLDSNQLHWISPSYSFACHIFRFRIIDIFGWFSIGLCCFTMEIGLGSTFFRLIFNLISPLGIAVNFVKTFHLDAIRKRYHVCVCYDEICSQQQTNDSSTITQYLLHLVESIWVCVSLSSFYCINK